MVGIERLTVPKASIKRGWCGPGIVANIAEKILGKKIDQNSLAQMMNTDHNGTNHTGLVKGFNELGLSAEWQTLNFENEPLAILNKYLQNDCSVVVNWWDGRLEDFSSLMLKPDQYERHKDHGHYSEYFGIIKVDGTACVVLGDAENIGSIRIIRTDDFIEHWQDFEINHEDRKEPKIRLYYRNILVVNNQKRLFSHLKEAV